MDHGQSHAHLILEKRVKCTVVSVQLPLVSVSVQLPLVSTLSKIRISVPPDLRPLDARQSILLAVYELESRFPQGLQQLNPVKDMKIEDPEVVDLVNHVEELEHKLFAHPLNKSQDGIILDVSKGKQRLIMRFKLDVSTVRFSLSRSDVSFK